MLTVYLSNQQIRVLEGSGGRRPAIRQAYTFDAPEGSLINGVVTDEEALSRALAEFWKQHRLPAQKVQLVVSSTQLVSRAVDAPKQSPRARAEYLVREFSDGEQLENPVFGWWEISENAQKHTFRLAATMGQRAYLEGLAELFRKAGIRLCGICTALDAALAALACLPQGRRTCILQIADGSSLLHILLVNGVYVYSTTDRLYSVPGSPEFGNEAAHKISNILQFVRAQRIEAEIRDVFLAGMGQADEQQCAAAMQQLAPMLTVQRLGCGTGFSMDKRLQPEFGFYLYAAGGLAQAGNKTDLLHGLENDPERRRQNRVMWRRMMPSIVLGSVLAATCLFCGARHMVLTGRVDGIIAYLSSAQVADACADYDRLTAQNTILQAGLNEMQDDWAALNSYPRANSRLEAVLQQCTEGYEVTVTFSSYDSAEGQLNLVTTAADVQTIHEYVAVLRQQSVFESVDYTGYNYNTANGNWTVNVSCVLSEQAGK
jgi:hypothetical protein